MKFILLLVTLLFFSIYTIAQQTYVPDDAFENYIETHFPAADNGVANDDSVFTAGVVGGGGETAFLFTSAENILDFTGIQDFTALAKIYFYNSPMQHIDLSGWNIGNINMSDPNWWEFNGLAMRFADCSNLETIEMPHGNIAGLSISGPMDNLYSINFQTSNNFVYQVDLTLNAPNLDVLDFSNTAGFTFAKVAISGDLNCIFLDNGQSNNIWLGYFNDTDPSNGTVCVRVDDPSYSNAQWSSLVTYTDFCASCVTGIEEHEVEAKSLIQITDILGRVTIDKPNTVLIYYYSDGSFERKYRIE